MTDLEKLHAIQALLNGAYNDPILEGVDGLYAEADMLAVDIQLILDY